MRVRVSLLALVLLATAAGCASAKKAYTSGMDREVAGDYDGAAREYATALERDPALPNVRGRLAVAGREAVRGHLSQARVARPVDAAGAYLAADGLVARAARVGVEVERPPSFEADRDAARDGAVARLTDDADARLAAGDHAGSLAQLRQTAVFGPSPRRQAAVDAMTLDAYGGWALADLDAGRYRDGLAHVDAALDRAPDDGGLLDLRAAILDAGTLLAAVLPAEGDAPPAFLRDLDDVLADERLDAPPPFVALVDPAEVRRWDRRVRDDGDDPARGLARAARDLGADLAVAVRVPEIVEDETAGEPRRESAERRDRPVLVPYTVRTHYLTVRAGAQLAAADRAGRRACDRAAQAEAQVVYDQASTTADWRDLALTRAQRDAFDPDAADVAYGRALELLRDRLASALAAEVTACVRGRVG